MRVSIVSPDQTFFDRDAASVVLPAVDGELGVLPGHAPLIARLGHGIARIQEREGAAPTRVAIYGGFLKVQRDVVSVLAGGAATFEGTPDAAAKEAARSAYAAAQAKVGEVRAAQGSASELAEAEEQLRRSRAYHQLLSPEAL